MNKLLIALLGLGIAGYFIIYKRPPAVPKEVKVVEKKSEQVSAESVVEKPIVSQVAVNVVSPALVVSAAVVAEEELKVTSVEPEDEPIENVDQTVIANESRLTASRSAEEAFELLRKVRFRPKSFQDISTVAMPKDFIKFLGSYEGQVFNNRREPVFTLKLLLQEYTKEGNQLFKGNLETIKPGEPPMMTELLGNGFGYQLVGRDSLVINGPDDNYIQLYKLNNGYLAGNFYDRSSKRTRTYRFILKNK